MGRPPPFSLPHMSKLHPRIPTMPPKQLPFEYQCPWVGEWRLSLRFWKQGCKWRKFWSSRYKECGLEDVWACPCCSTHSCPVGKIVSGAGQRRLSEHPFQARVPSRPSLITYWSLWETNSKRYTQLVSRGTGNWTQVCQPWRPKLIVSAYNNDLF